MKELELYKKKLLDKAFELGCLGFEFFENSQDELFMIGMGHWESKEDLERFHKFWKAYEKESYNLFAKPVRMELFLSKGFFEKKRKTA